MDKIPFENGQKTQEAFVTIEEKNYPVTPAKYSGKIPLSGPNLMKLQNNIENSVEEYIYNLVLNSNIDLGGEITLPFKYKVGANVLQVYYMGQLLLQSSDDVGTDGHYREVGEADSISNKIKLTSDWSAETGEYFKFVVKGVYSNETT